jgi:hypothetical protein
MPQETITFVTSDFVYTGRRWREGKFSVTLRRVTEAGVLEDSELVYAYSKEWKRFAVGGVYRGASFSESSIRGFVSALMERRWDDAMDRAEWAAREEDALAQERTARLEEDTRKTNEIADILVPLRARYDALRKRYDRPGMVAIENAVLRALREPLRLRERTE